MSIYESTVEGIDSKSTKRKSTGNPVAKVDTKKILNDKDLTIILKDVTGFKGTAKELLHDTDGELVGVLQKDDDVYLFDDKEVKDLKNYKGD